VDRPLWQILLAIALLGLAVQRGAVAAVAFGGAAPREVAIASAVEAAVAVLAAIGLWVGGRAARMGVVALGVAVAAHAAILVWVFGAPAVPAAVGRILLAALSAGALFWVLRREFDLHPGPDARRTTPNAAERTGRGAG